MAFYEPAATQWVRDLAELRKRLLGAVVAILAVTAFGIVGFLIIDPEAGFIRAFYMTAITLTTVGYDEEIPVDTETAMVFTAVLILVGMGSVLYFVSTATAFFLEGQLGHVFRRRRMERTLADLDGHHIVCGSGRTAFYAGQELHQIGRTVVFAVQDEDAAVDIDHALTDALVVLGDPTDDEVLIAAGVERAAGLIACTGSDNDNVVIALTARHLNPEIRIVVRIEDVNNEPKLRKVGADAIVSPPHIGGLRLASELVRPAVVTFLDTMMRDRELNLRIEEVTLGDAIDEGADLGSLRLDDVPGALLLATRDAGSWRYNPSDDHPVRSGTVLVFLGTPEDSARVRSHLGAT